VKITRQSWSSVAGFQRRLFAEAMGSQIVEFAVALPLLLVMVIGILDFGGAFNLKQKLINVTREAARVGAGQATSDLSNAPPPSILALRDVVANYLQNAKVDNCNLNTAAATPAGGGNPWKWTFTTACPQGGNLVLTINRGNVFLSSVTTGGNAMKIISTEVTVSYPYVWQFNRVIKLIAPAASYPGTTQILTDAVVTNES
jgi:Flp pilus assembly protein TadG